MYHMFLLYHFNFIKDIHRNAQYIVIDKSSVLNCRRSLYKYFEDVFHEFMLSRLSNDKPMRYAHFNDMYSKCNHCCVISSSRSNPCVFKQLVMSYYFLLS